MNGERDKFVDLDPEGLAFNVVRYALFGGDRKFGRAVVRRRLVFQLDRDVRRGNGIRLLRSRERIIVLIFVGKARLQRMIVACGDKIALRKLHVERDRVLPGFRAHARKRCKVERIVIVIRIVVTEGSLFPIYSDRAFFNGELIGLFPVFDVIARSKHIVVVAERDRGGIAARVVNAVDITRSAGILERDIEGKIVPIAQAVRRDRKAALPVKCAVDALPFRDAHAERDRLRRDREFVRNAVRGKLIVGIPDASDRDLVRTDIDRFSVCQAARNRRDGIGERQALDVVAKVCNDFRTRHHRLMGAALPRIFEGFSAPTRYFESERADRKAAVRRGRAACILDAQLEVVLLF